MRTRYDAAFRDFAPLPPGNHMTRWRLLLVLVLVAVASALALRFVLDGQARKPAPMACYGWNAADPSCRFVDSLVRKLGPRQYSQGFEELIIRDFLGDRRDGFFLDVGSSQDRKSVV